MSLTHPLTSLAFAIINFYYGNCSSPPSTPICWSSNQKCLQVFAQWDNRIMSKYSINSQNAHFLRPLASLVITALHLTCPFVPPWWSENIQPQVSPAPGSWAKAGFATFCLLLGSGKNNGIALLLGPVSSYPAGRLLPVSGCNNSIYLITVVRDK